MKIIKEISLVCFCLFFINLQSQNENKIWYFGNYAGLNFSTNPPTTLTNSAMYSSEGCSTVSDVQGNLLFYTDGISVWNKNHNLMANGFGLMGHPSASQSGLVVKQPGNANIYFVFTVDVAGGTNGLRYSKVDINLAAGMGSVTVKNALLYSPSTEKLTAVKTSNGLDIWIMTHEWGSDKFVAYKLTAAGVNTTAIISSIGTVHGGSNIQNAVGCMKISPDGTKIGLAISNSPFDRIELYDFNSTTGIVSNSLTLQAGTAFVYGVEFSSNSSKFYATQISSYYNATLTQWDISSNNSTSILASAYNFYPSISCRHYGIQLAPNSKIYVVNENSNYLSVIDYPNLPGAACGFSINAQTLGNATALIGLPAFVSMPYKEKIINIKMKDPQCSGSVEFQSPYTINQILNNNTVLGYSVTSLYWNFGDPTSNNNTSTISNPFHNYSSPGTYSIQLVIQYSGGVMSDTLHNAVTVQLTEPTFTINHNSPTCERGKLNFSIQSNSVLTNFYWSGPNGYISLNSTNSLSNCNMLMTGKYKFNALYGNGCKLKDSINFFVNAIPKLVAQNATVCSNEPVDLVGTGADLYNWRGPLNDSCKSNNYHFSAVNLSNSGTYTLIGIMNTGCTASITLNLFVAELPTMKIDVTPSNKICLNEVLSFITPSNLITEWHGPKNFYTTKSNINFWANSVDMSGNYSLTLRNQLGCESKTIIPIFIQPLPEIAISGITQPKCVPVNINYEVLNKNNAISINWEVENKKYDGNNLKYYFDKAGTYNVFAKIVDLNSKCTNSYTYFVNVLPNTKADFRVSPTLAIEGLDEISLINNLKYDSKTEYNWEVSNGLTFINKQEPKFIIENSGIYLAVLTTQNNYGCVDTCSRKITVKPNVRLFAPNVFTPNNDQINEVFKPVLYGAYPLRLCVFNRWGNIVFDSNNQQAEWDGSYQNQACKEDAYYWTFEYRLENNITKSENGVVMLIR